MIEPEPDDIGLLAYCQRGDPNWDKAVLHVEQPEIRMRNDVKIEFSVPPAMHVLSSGWARIEGKSLAAIRALFADKADRVVLLELVLR